jgi:hypothetical protein
MPGSLLPQAAGTPGIHFEYGKNWVFAEKVVFSFVKIFSLYAICILL